MPTPIPYGVKWLSRDPIQVISGAQTVYSINVVSYNDYKVYLKFWDNLAANVNILTDTPSHVIEIPARDASGTGRVNDPATNWSFSNAVSISCTLGSAVADTRTAPLALVEFDIATAGVSGTVDSVNGHTGTVVLVPADIGSPSGSGTSTGTNTGDQTVPSTLTNVSHKWLNSYDSSTGLFTQTQPASTDVSGLGTLATQSGTFSGTSSGTNTGDQTVPSNTAAVSHQTLTAYNSTTGAFTQAQLANTDISGLGTLSTQSGTFSGTSSGTNTGDQTITLTGDVTGSGTGSFAATVASNQKLASIGITIDGGGSALTTGVKGYLYVPYACTISSATMLADQSGSAVVDIWKTTYANFDAGSTHPVSGDKITSATPPTISSTTKSQDTTLSSWTTSISAGDVLGFNVTSATTITRVTLVLKVSKT